MTRIIVALTVPFAFILLAGCSTLNGQAPPAVNIPSDCDNLATQVPYPPVVKNEDLGVRSAKYAAALKQANGKLDAVASCDAAVRQSFKP